MKKLIIKNLIGQNKLIWFILLYSSATVAFGIVVTIGHIIVKFLRSYI